MGKNVVGVYTSSFEAVKAIHSMRQDGIERKHICVLSNDDYGATIIEEKTGVDVEHDFNSSLEKRHLWKDLKSSFQLKVNRIQAVQIIYLKLVCLNQRPSNMQVRLKSGNSLSLLTVNMAGKEEVDF